jgi:hypothetical protein
MTWPYETEERQMKGAYVAYGLPGIIRTIAWRDTPRPIRKPPPRRT